MSELQLDLFPTSGPEVKGQLAAMTVVVLRGLIEALIANGQITPQQARTVIYEADLKTGFAIWDSLQGENCGELEEQEERFLSGLRKDFL